MKKMIKGIKSTNTLLIIITKNKNFSSYLTNCNILKTDVMFINIWMIQSNIFEYPSSSLSIY